MTSNPYPALVAWLVGEADGVVDVLAPLVSDAIVDEVFEARGQSALLTDDNL